MKHNIHWKTVICIILLCFSLPYLVTRLICSEMYVDAIFAIVIVILLPLLIHFIRKGE